MHMGSTDRGKVSQRVLSLRRAFQLTPAVHTVRLSALRSVRSHDRQRRPR